MPRAGKRKLSRRPKHTLNAPWSPCKASWWGAAAALEHPGRGDSLNYEEIFLRDNVPVMFHLLLKGRYRLVRHFLVLCMNLQSSEHQTRGLFPTSFIEENGTLVADYGQRSIGRISSVDASLWWPILCWFYVSHSKDWQFGIDQQVQRAVQRLLDLVMQPSFEGTPVLFVPDCSFMIDRPMDVWGAPLEIQVLLYGCLKACVKLMEHAQEVSPSPSRLLSQRVLLTREWIHRLRSYLLKHYWVTSKTILGAAATAHRAVRGRAASQRVQRAAQRDSPLAAGLAG